MNKVEIGRRIREQNSGPVEALTCEQFGLVQKGGSQTKIDGTHPLDGTNWSIKNTGSRSTQVHLTTKKKFAADFQLNELQTEFVNKFLETNRSIICREIDIKWTRLLRRLLSLSRSSWKTTKKSLSAMWSAEKTTSIMWSTTDK